MRLWENEPHRGPRGGSMVEPLCNTLQLNTYILLQIHVTISLPKKMIWDYTEYNKNPEIPKWDFNK